MNNCVYRFMDDKDEIIYIGKAKKLKQRLETHSHLPNECYAEKSYIEYIEFDSEEDMDFAERYFIQTISPKYNTILANKNISISSFELDSKVWIPYGVALDVCENKCQEDTQISNKRVIKDMQIINIKVETIRDMVREDFENDLLSARLSKLLDEQKKIKKEFVNIFKLNNEPQWLIDEYIKNNTTDKNELIQIKIEEVEKMYYEKCIEEINEKGYYKLDIYEEIDQHFVYSDWGREKEWYKLLDGKELKHFMLKYKIDTDIKNKIVLDIIKRIENKIKIIYGDFNRKIIMKNASSVGSYMCAFYPDYEYMKFEKPFIVHEVRKVS